MTVLQLANILQSVAVAVLFIFVFFHILRTVRLDSLRQDIFAIRDELFDYAADGNIPFEDPAYKLLRDQMNGLLRYAHQLTLFRFLMSVLIDKVKGSADDRPWNSAWERSLDNLKDPKQKVDMTCFHDRAMNKALFHLIFGSPLLLSALFTAMICIGLGIAGAASYSGIRQLAKAASQAILIGPLDPKHLEEEAVAA